MNVHSDNDVAMNEEKSQIFHKKYGFYRVGWYDVQKCENRYQVNENCIIRNKKTERVKQEKTNCINSVELLCEDGIYKSDNKGAWALTSIFSNIVKTPILHQIDHNPNNWNIQNLEFMTTEEYYDHLKLSNPLEKCTVYGNHLTVPRANRNHDKINTSLTSINVHDRYGQFIGGHTPITIESYQHKYVVDDECVVTSLSTGKALTERNNYVTLSDKNTKDTAYLKHALALLTFFPQIREGPIIHHRDHDEKNCRIENLEFLTDDEHNIHLMSIDDKEKCVFHINRIYNENIDLPQQELTQLIHPKYGLFSSGYTNLLDSGFSMFQVNHWCQIRSESNILTENKSHVVSLQPMLNGKRTCKQKPKWEYALSTFFPNVVKQPILHFIDHNPRNWNICNLEYMTMTEHQSHLSSLNINDHCIYFQDNIKVEFNNMVDPSLSQHHYRYGDFVGGWMNIVLDAAYPGYQVNDKCEVKSSKDIIMTPDDKHRIMFQRTIGTERNCKRYSKYQLALSTFFPSVNMESILHLVDHNTSNWNISNLEYLTHEKHQLHLSGLKENDKCAYVDNTRRGERKKIDITQISSGTIIIHPKYGNFVSGFRNLQDPSFSSIQVNDKCEFKSQAGYPINERENHKVLLYQNVDGKRKESMRVKWKEALKAFFPDVIELPVLHHINHHADDWNICNLEYITNEEHKSHLLTLKSENECVFHVNKTIKSNNLDQQIKQIIKCEEDIKKNQNFTHLRYGEFTIGWKPINEKDLEHYEINENGQIRKLHNMEVLKSTSRTARFVMLDGSIRHKSREYLALRTFFPNANLDGDSHHVDHNETNFNIMNLEMLTKSEIKIHTENKKNGIQCIMKTKVEPFVQKEKRIKSQEYTIIDLSHSKYGLTQTGWRDVTEACYGGNYQISHLCEIRSKKNGYLKWENKEKNEVALSVDGKNKWTSKTKLALRTFFPNVQEEEKVIFIDNDENNYNITNLKWGTRQEKYQSLQDEARVIKNHAVYGDYLSGFRPLHDPLFLGHYEINDQCEIRSYSDQCRGENFSIPEDDRVKLQVDNYVQVQTRGHWALLAFFPGILVKPTINHIDHNHNNWDLRNIEFATRKENTEHSLAIQPRQAGAALSKPIEKIDPVTGDVLKTYASVNDAANANMVDSRVISNAAKHHYKLEGFYYRYVDQPDLEDEQWKPLSQLAKDFLYKNYETKESIANVIQCSNKGRVLTCKGIKTRGSKSKKYKAWFVGIDEENVLIHYLIFLTWCNVPDTWDRRKELKLVICHDDSAPLFYDERPQGRYRNWPEDLRLDTMRNNIKESHEKGQHFKTKKRKAEELEKGNFVKKIKVDEPLNEDSNELYELSNEELDEAFYEESDEELNEVLDDAMGVLDTPL